MAQILFFTQPGCLSCEVMRMFLEAKELAFEERDMSVDPAVRNELIEVYRVTRTPTVVIVSGASLQVIEGFHPDRVEECLGAA